MNILLDMNLSPSWQDALENKGHRAVHWSAVGAPDASDRTLIEWARDHEYVVFTHDLDFGAILAASQANAPSVVQLRIQDISPETACDYLIQVIERFEEELRRGALLSLDADSCRVRILPLAT